MKIKDRLGQRIGVIEMTEDEISRRFEVLNCKYIAFNCSDVCYACIYSSLYIYIAPFSYESVNWFKNKLETRNCINGIPEIIITLFKI